ncbi:glycosyltransferase family 2 protein [Cellulosilyticum ruminicola]|uniref:glycosyltransferase family 2 protein n=1 Tax=Cellulosilyticum ruminicola TaxID=425254 RepID=UPI0009FAA58E|nr:glycosyltransferase family 2 protein [Cellulosilyticum ruminicola]
MGKIDISIVIPNYNGEKYLKPCLESIYVQDYRDYEIIIIDNDSTDSDYKWLKDYGEIKFKRLDQNYGFSRAVNEGIKMAQGKYVLLLNNDTALCQGFLSEMHKVMEKDKKIFSISSKMIQYYNRKLIDDAGDAYTILGWAYKRGDGKSVNQYIKQERIFSSCAGAALYRKAVFEVIGYFDEMFFAYMEDVDVSYRGNIYGYKNIYLPTAKVYHIGSATSGSRYNSFKVKLAARNNIYVPYKNMPLFQLIINGPFLVIGYLIKFLWFKQKGFGQDYIKGINEAFKGLKDIKRTPFKFKHLNHYIYIEWLLIKNTFDYAIDKMIHKMLKIDYTKEEKING